MIISGDKAVNKRNKDAAYLKLMFHMKNEGLNSGFEQTEESANLKIDQLRLTSRRNIK